MKFKRIGLFILFLIFLSINVFADNALVIYAAGSAEIRSGSTWKPVKTGDLLPDTGTVRVGPGGLLELSFKKQVITIYEGGTLSLKDAFASSTQMQSGNTMASIDDKIRKVAGADDDRYKKNTAMGVRGDIIEGDTGMMWADDESDPIPEGKKLLADGKYPDAISYFLAIISETHNPVYDPFLYYYLVYACSKNNERARALQYLNKMAIGPDHPLYPDYVMLKGRLLLEAFAYNGALTLFNDYLSRFPKGDAAQAVLLLSAYGHKGLGDKAKQKESLVKAEGFDPKTDVGKEAYELLKGLK